MFLPIRIFTLYTKRKGDATHLTFSTSMLLGLFLSK